MHAMFNSSDKIRNKQTRRHLNTAQSTVTSAPAWHVNMLANEFFSGFQCVTPIQQFSYWRRQSEGGREGGPAVDEAEASVNVCNYNQFLLETHTDASLLLNY